MSMVVLKIYSVSSDITGGEVNVKKLHAEISATSHVTNFASITKNDDNLDILGDALVDESALNALIQSHVACDLTEYKQVKNDAINKRTSELISLGATFDGKTFSLSGHAQRNWVVLFDHPEIQTWPVRLSTIDDQRYDLDQDDLTNFFLTMMVTVRTHYFSGGDLRDVVNVATDKAGVDAVVDNR